MTIQEFFSKLEADGKQPLANHEAVRMLLQRASEGMSQPFLDACFQAKFLVRSQEVMRRIGRGAEGFDQMAAEFQSSVERTTTLLRTVVKEAPTESRDRFVNEFLLPTNDSFDRFLSLCHDLTRIKNWQVDGRPLPFLPESPTADPTSPNSRNVSMKDLLRASRLALLLFMLLLIIDGPELIIGWITAFVLVGLFVIIEFAAARQHSEKGA